MSAIKMSDVFTLPLRTCEGAVEDDDESNLASFATHKQDDYAVLAINSHDTLTARVAELEALIREASDYLTENRLSSIGSASILHTKFREALLEAKP